MIKGEHRWWWRNKEGWGVNLGVPFNTPYDPNGWTLRMVLQMLRAFTSITYERAAAAGKAGPHLSIWFGVGTVLIGENTVYLSFWPNLRCSPNGGLLFLYGRTFYLGNHLTRLLRWC